MRMVLTKKKKLTNVIILDAGHGGLVDGVYQTKGKRSPIWNNGSYYFEGVGNREIVKKLTYRLQKKGIEVFNSNDSQRDLPLYKRVKNINNEIKNNKSKKYIGVSVHSNGYSSNQANGWEVFVSKNSSQESKEMAKISERHFQEEFPKSKNRGIKKSNFYILKNTKCPFILTENFFHTNEKECRKILMTEEGQDKIVNFHFDFIMKYLNK